MCWERNSGNQTTIYHESKSQKANKKSTQLLTTPFLMVSRSLEWWEKELWHTISMFSISDTRVRLELCLASNTLELGMSFNLSHVSSNTWCAWNLHTLCCTTSISLGTLQRKWCTFLPGARTWVATNKRRKLQGCLNFAWFQLQHSADSFPWTEDFPYATKGAAYGHTWKYLDSHLLVTEGNEASEIAFSEDACSEIQLFVVAESL